MKLRFLPFFGCFHSANGDFGSGNFVPPTIQPARHRFSEHRRLCAEIPQFHFPTLCVPFFRFRHTQKNTFAFLVPLALSQIAISSCGLDFGLPVARDDLDCLRSSFLIRAIIAAHAVQSAGSNAALIGGSTLALSCCAVIKSATEPMMRAAAINIRIVTVSPAKRAPNRTATIGFT